jgi:SAM-dependent methyltransferase
MKSKADSYMEHVFSELGHERDFRNVGIVSLIAPRLSGKTILDMGCGNGYYIFNFRKLGFDVVGLEQNKTLIKDGKKLFGEMKIINCNAEDAEKMTKGRKFDNIVLLDVLEHVKDDVRILSVCRRILEDRGRVIILVPAHQSLYSKKDYNTGHYRRYSRRGLRSAVERAGLKINEMRYWNISMLPAYALYKIFDVDRIAVSARKKRGRNSLLLHWFTKVEKRNLGYGLSLLCVCEKRK